MPRGSSSPRRHNQHGAVAEKARADRGAWVLAGVYPTPSSATAAAQRIVRAEPYRAYAPAGTFEAYPAPHDDGHAVWVRDVTGLPKPGPRPLTKKYRVCDRGTGPGYEGVRVAAVIVSSECPRCGGPRGDAEPHRFPEDGDWYTVDKWTNPCGHTDSYDAVRAEYRRNYGRLVEAAERPVDPADAAGEYRVAVEMIRQVGAVWPRMRAVDAAWVLAWAEEHEAARRIAEELNNRAGNMSARQAAAFLVDLALARARCRDCRGGRIDYRARDGEFVSLRCPRCRRDVVPHA